MRKKTLAYLYFGLRCFCIGTAIYGNGIDLESIHLAECLIALEISLLLRIRLTQRASSFGSLRSICHGGPNPGICSLHLYFNVAIPPR